MMRAREATEFLRRENFMERTDTKIALAKLRLRRLLKGETMNMDTFSVHSLSQADFNKLAEDVRCVSAGR
jgi:hypothetical protein